MEKNFNVPKPCYSKQILPIPAWHFVTLRFHYSTNYLLSFITVIEAQ